MNIPHHIDDILHANGTPLIDKALVTIGVGSSAVLGFISLGEVQSLLLFLVTFSMILPRALMNWDKRAEWKRRQKLLREQEEKDGVRFCDIKIDDDYL